MKYTVSREDYEKLVNLLRAENERGVTISDAVKGMERTGVSVPQAKVVVRRAIDRGEVRTDRNFRLHLSHAS